MTTSAIFKYSHCIWWICSNFIYWSSQNKNVMFSCTSPFNTFRLLNNEILFCSGWCWPWHSLTFCTSWPACCSSGCQLSTPGTWLLKVLWVPQVPVLKVTSLGARLLHHPQLHVSYKHGQCIRAKHAFVMALRHCATICTVYLGAKCDKKLRNGRNVATAFLYCPSLHKSYMIFLRQMLFLYGVNSHNCLYFTFAPPRQTRAQSPSSAEIS